MSKTSSPTIIFPNGQEMGLDKALSFAGFEGARTSKDRARIYFPNLSTRTEIGPTNRREILRKSRWFYNNHGFPKRIISGVADELGSLRPSVRSEDRDFRDASLRAWAQLTSSAQVFDLGQAYNFTTIQTALSRSELKDGDVGVAFSRGADGRARVRIYEGHEIGDDPSIASDDSWLDGVRINRHGAAVAYRLSPDGKTSEAGLTVPASAFHLIFRKERPGQPRGIGALHGCVNNLIDWTEIMQDTKKGIKVANLIGFYLKTNSPQSSVHIPGAGVVPPASYGADEDEAESNDSAGSEEGPIRPAPMDQAFDSGVIPQYPELTEPAILHDSRPGPNQRAMLQDIARECAWSIGLPPELVWEAGTGSGSTQRWLMESAQEWLDRRRAEVLVPFCQRVWFHVIGTEIAAGRLREPSGKIGWWEVDWIPGKRKTIDRGREGRLNLEERQRPGMRTLERHFAELGKDWEPEVIQWFSEIDRIEKVARERGWSDERVEWLVSAMTAAPQGAATGRKQ